MFYIGHSHLYPSTVVQYSSSTMPVHTPITDSESDDGPHKMELIFFSNDFPRDDLHDVFRRLHNHSKDKHFPVLAQFIHESTWAIKDEIRQLPTELKQLIPPFNTLLAWAENTQLREGLICSAVDGVLLVLVQLATYIG